MHKETSQDDLIYIKNQLEAGEPDLAMERIIKCMDFDLDNPRLLFTAGLVLLRAKKYGLAYQMLYRAKELKPERPELYNAIGLVYQNMGEHYRAEKNFLKAIEKYPENHPGLDEAMNNLALVYVNQCKYDQGLEWAEKCLELNPNMLEAQESKSLALLAQGKWREGWVNYESMLGVHKQRFERTYCEPEEPRWDGAPGKVVVVYGEQGLGDEVYFSSCIPDALKVCQQVIIDCDYRLQGLFRRSFPSAIVYGTRFDDKCPWTLKHAIDARCSIGTLPKFFRNEDSEFPGTPWLIPDPQRKLQWQSLLDDLGPGPKIGLAWTGGNQWTGEERRSITLEALLPVIKSVPHGTFVSLQYKGDTEKEIRFFEDAHGIKIHHWERAVRKGCDVDDTAALISALDCIVSVTTSAIHLAGSIGTKAFCLVPEKPRWLYQTPGPYMKWYGTTVEKFKQSGTEWRIKEVAEAVAQYCGGGDAIHHRSRSKGNSINRSVPKEHEEARDNADHGVTA